MYSINEFLDNEHPYKIEVVELEVDARLGFEAEKVADYKGLRGDPSDNIPGVL